MIDLSPYDSPRGVFPRETTPRLERVLHVHLNTPQEPQPSLCEALRNLTVSSPPTAWSRIDWTAFKDRTQRVRAILDAAEKVRPTLVFMQLQTQGVLSPDDLRAIRLRCDPSCVFVSWCGDIGRDPRWSHELAPELDVVAFSSMTQVREHRAAGFPNAAYLQIGYDEDIHHEPESGPALWTRWSDGVPHERKRRVVFLGQNYNDNAWGRIEHEAQLRRDMVDALARADVPFVLGGTGWIAHGAQTTTKPVLYNRFDSAVLYQTSRAAISVSLTSKFERYSSDRLLRALACGPVVLVKRFDDMKSWGLRHRHNCMVWDGVEYLVEWTQTVLDWPQHELAEIGQAGAELARTKHTWGQRMRELAVYVEGVRNAREA